MTAKRWSISARARLRWSITTPGRRYYPLFPVALWAKLGHKRRLWVVRHPGVLWVLSGGRAEGAPAGCGRPEGGQVPAK